MLTAVNCLQSVNSLAVVTSSGLLVLQTQLTYLQVSWRLSLSFDIGNFYLGVILTASSQGHSLPICNSTWPHTLFHDGTAWGVLEGSHDDMQAPRDAEQTSL